MAARDPITVVMMGAPVPFARMRTGNGKHFVPSPQRNAAAVMRVEAWNAMRQSDWTMFDESVSLTLRAVLPIPKSWSSKKKERALLGEIRPTAKPDLDNIQKLVTDSFNSICFKDDAQVVSVHAEKVYGLTPCLIATVQPAARPMSIERLFPQSQWHPVTAEGGVSPP